MRLPVGALFALKNPRIHNQALLGIVIFSDDHMTHIEWMGNWVDKCPERNIEQRGAAMPYDALLDMYDLVLP